LVLDETIRSLNNYLFSLFQMVFYSFEMVLVGIILLSAMGVGGIKLWLKRKNKANQLQNITDSDLNDSNL